MSFRSRRSAGGGRPERALERARRGAALAQDLPDGRVRLVYRAPVRARKVAGFLRRSGCVAAMDDGSRVVIAWAPCAAEAVSDKMSSSGAPDDLLDAT